MRRAVSFNDACADTLRAEGARMSWYLANEDGIPDQFASVGGLRDLLTAAADTPALDGSAGCGPCA